MCLEYRVSKIPRTNIWRKCSDSAGLKSQGGIAAIKYLDTGAGNWNNVINKFRYPSGQPEGFLFALFPENAAFLLLKKKKKNGLVAELQDNREKTVKNSGDSRKAMRLFL